MGIGGCTGHERVGLHGMYGGCWKLSWVEWRLCRFVYGDGLISWKLTCGCFPRIVVARTIQWITSSNRWKHVPSAHFGQGRHWIMLPPLYHSWNLSTDATHDMSRGCLAIPIQLGQL